MFALGVKTPKPGDITICCTRIQTFPHFSGHASIVCTEGGNDEGNEMVLFALMKWSKNEDTFWGLCLDEDNQDELTQERITKWVEKIKEEF